VVVVAAVVVVVVVGVVAVVAMVAIATQGALGIAPGVVLKEAVRLSGQKKLR
jgi:hypothetical protein